ncbi:xylosidase arabinosidase [Colletotrichum tofieldiae]|nr:xylosidase arabinosidase [Colletotrichum tofieldiae]
MAPLINHLYTADPSAHVFNGKIYIYPSHDRETDIKFNDNGDQYDMADYHVFSTSSLNPLEPVVDHGVVLKTEDVPWDIFRIGVAVSDKPEGPFTPDPEPIKGSYSIDPASFVDDDGQGYLYFGGLWGGQLQCYQKGNDAFDAEWLGPKEPSGEGAYALGPRVAKLTDDMHQFDGEVQEIQILDPETKKPIAADDHDRRFFEAAWLHKKDGLYYFSYSTGDTHYICYAISDSPLGPSPTVDASSSPCWAGRRTTPSSSSRANGGSSTMTAS